jgi:diphthamide biosynthesis methyltransferase
LRHNPTRREGQHKTLATTHSELVLEAIEAQPNKEGRSTQNITATTHSGLVLEAIEAQPNKEGRSTHNITATTHSGLD